MDRSDTNPGPASCPQCGAVLPAQDLGGLCPACLLRRGAEETVPTSAASFQPPSLEAMARLFPQLEIQRFIGRGGMGAVFQARQPALDRLVAVKVLPQSGEPGFAERFQREARALARLNHPNIVAVHDFGQVEGLWFFMMEYVDGLTLRQLERSGNLSPREALKVVPQICEALQYAHDSGIVHRDIKPENILIDRNGRVKIADFGIAKIMGGDAADPALTVPLQTIGTPHYMAPEQVEQPQTVDHRADIFSLGVVFYEMLTGELPLGRFAPPSCKVAVDVRLDDVVLRALEKERELRYQKVSSVKTAVETIVSVPPTAPTTRRTWRERLARESGMLASAVLAGLVLAGVFGFLIGGEIFLPTLGFYLAVGTIARGGLWAIEWRRKSRLRFALALSAVALLPLVFTAAAGTYVVGFNWRARAGANTTQVIRNTIWQTVGRQLRDAGATYDSLEVSVAERTEISTPFRVNYRGLRNFKGKDGSTPAPEGSFVMHYAGGGEWRGTLAGTEFRVPVGSRDNIDLPFVDDPQVIGEWESVDFVAEPEEFTPASRVWSGEFPLARMTFLPNGKTPQPWFTWTKGYVIHHGDKTASRYEIRAISGQRYLFFEWKSGDVMISGRKPYYYVLKRKS